ncbi:MAG: guanylate kinase [Peptococcia bacterium]|jgi:guanylate kinase
MFFQKDKGNLIVISGPSGVGKGTVCRALLEKHEDLVLSISATTRKARVGEKEGREYFFYTQEKFLELIKKKAFLEWAKVFDNYYGTPLAYVQKILQQGQDCLLEIDVQGALQVKAKWPTGIFIFLVPPSHEELVRRITCRGTENTAEIQKRLQQAEEEIGHLREYDYIVVNNFVQEAVEKIRAIIVAERCRTFRWEW